MSFEENMKNRLEVFKMKGYYMASPLTNIECFLLWSLGKIVASIGFIGFIICICADMITDNVPFNYSHFDWFQITGCVVTWGIAILGVYGDKFLNTTIREIINEWAEN